MRLAGGRITDLRHACASVAAALIVATCSTGSPTTSPTSSSGPSPASPPAALSPTTGAASPSGLTVSAELTFEQDDELATEGLITAEEGGAVTATARDGTTYELAVPPYAVAEDTVVMLTPLDDLRGVGDEPAFGVRLEPEGLEFWDWPRLTITPPAPIPVENQLTFQATGDGESVHAALIDITTDSITLLLPHFSTAGATYAEAVGLWEAEHSLSRIDRVAHEAGKVLREMKRRGLTVAGGDEDAAELADRLLPFLEEAEREAYGAMRSAAAISCGAVEIYIRTLIGLQRQRHLVGLANDEWVIANDAEISRVRGASFENCEREKIRQCRIEQDPSILISFWLIWERDRQLAGEGESKGPPADFIERATRICLQKDYRIDKTVAGSQGTGPGTITWSVHYTGIKCGGPEGEWVIDSAGTLTGGSDAAQFSGEITVQIAENTTTGPMRGVADFLDVDPDGSTQTRGVFTGTGTFDQAARKLVLDVTSGSGNGYAYGFHDQGIQGAGTLTFPLQEGDFCLEPPD
jgi:hypothetical protein